MTILADVADFLGYGHEKSDIVSIKVGSQLITGWTGAVIRVGAEIMPWTAELSLASQSPQSSAKLNISPGDTCQVLIGSQLVITGYVITVVDSLGTGGHDIRVLVASKSIDLVECAAEFSTYQMNSTNALALVQRVCQGFGITASAINAAGNIDIQQFSVILTETAYEVIERVCRLAGVLFYDQPDGNIVLSAVGSTRAASGFAIGQNIEQRTRVRSLAGRYSSIVAVIQNTVMLFTNPDEADYVGQMEAISSPAKAIDPGVTRHRPMLIPIELGDAGYRVAQQRVRWEVARRYGRSQSETVTCDSWRDAEGNLWQPNVRTPFTDTNGVCQDLLIGEVTFRVGKDGSHADVVLMPPEAFQPEPILLPALSNEAVQATNS